MGRLLPSDAWQVPWLDPDRGGVGPEFPSLVYIEVPIPYTAARGRLLSLDGGALLRHPARRIVIPQQEDHSMKRERLTFEMPPEVKTTLEAWAREEDRSIGSLLRRIVEKSVQERRAAAAGGAR